MVLEIQQIDHNLPSVLANPRDREGTSKLPNSSSYLYPFDVVSGKEHESLASFLASFSEEDFSSIEPFLRKMGGLATAFLHNHKLRGSDSGMMKQKNEGGSSSDIKPPLNPLYMKREDKFNGGKKHVSDTSVAACCKAVPPMYFSPKYSLQDPEVLERMLCKAEPEQQEELMNYLEIVETCLLDQIVSRSDAFLESLDTIHVLKRQASGIQALTTV